MFKSGCCLGCLSAQFRQFWSILHTGNRATTLLQQTSPRLVCPRETTRISTQLLTPGRWGPQADVCSPSPCSSLPSAPHGLATPEPQSLYLCFLRFFSAWTPSLRFVVYKVLSTKLSWFWGLPHMSFSSQRSQPCAIWCSEIERWQLVLLFLFLF